MRKLRFRKLLAEGQTKQGSKAKIHTQAASMQGEMMIQA